MEKTEPESNSQATGIKNKQAKVDYVKYEELLPYEQQTNFLELFREVTTNLIETPEFKWEIHFNSINDLRRLRKHSKDLFYTIAKDYNLCKEIFPKYINSIRSNLSKVTLMLVTELFSEFEYDNLNGMMSTLIPEVLNKSIDNKIFIREEAMKALQNLSENMFYEESIFALLLGVKSANPKISQNAFDTLINLIQNYEKLVLENIEGWKEIFKHISDIFLLKDDRHVKKSEKIVESLKEKLTKDLFEKVLKTSTKSSIIVINQILNPKKTKTKENKTKESLKDFKNRMLIDNNNKDNKNMENITNNEQNNLLNI